IFVFSGASTLTGSSLPDVILSGCTDPSTEDFCYINAPTDLTVVNNTLLVTNQNYNQNANNDSPGLAAFTPANNLFQNQFPAAFVSDDIGLGFADRVVAAGDALFITGGPNEYNSSAPYHSRAGVFIFRSTSLTTGQSPSLSIMGDDNTASISFFTDMTGIAAIVRGTSENVFDTGT